MWVVENLKIHIVTRRVRDEKNIFENNTRLLDPIVRVHNALHHYKHLCGSTVPTVPDKPRAQTVHCTGAPSLWNSVRTRHYYGYRSTCRK